MICCILDTLRLRQNYRHLADNIFKYIFLYENVWISLKISLKFAPKVWIHNISALVQIIWYNGLALTWGRAIIWTNDDLGYRCISASLGLNKLSAVVMMWCLVFDSKTRHPWVLSWYFINRACCPATIAGQGVQRSGKSQGNSRHGKSQGILLKVREKMNIGKSQGICI